MLAQMVALQRDCERWPVPRFAQMVALQRDCERWPVPPFARWKHKQRARSDDWRLNLPQLRAPLFAHPIPYPTTVGNRTQGIELRTPLIA
eukprot:363781-Chlamydomonas_euryale.AAC.24